MRVKIPNYKTLNLDYLILDYNGTIAIDGILKQECKSLLKDLAPHIHIFVITADTFGTVQEQLAPFKVEIKVV